MRKERSKRDRKVRFLEKVSERIETGCWEWIGPKYKPPKLPYGIFYWGFVDGKEKMMTAHRASWHLHNPTKILPAGAHLCHRCNNPSCVNPNHLYIGDALTNAADRDAAGTTSRGDKRYNFKRNDDLIERIKTCVQGGLTIPETRAALGIGWTTVYRCRDQDQELRTLMAETKSARYSKAQKRRH